VDVVIGKRAKEIWDVTQPIHSKQITALIYEDTELIEKLRKLNDFVIEIAKTLVENGLAKTVILRPLEKMNEEVTIIGDEKEVERIEERDKEGKVIVLDTPLIEMLVIKK